MKPITTNEAAQRLGVHPTRIHALIRSGRLPAQKVGRDWIINEKDLALVAVRKVGRPSKKTSKKARKPPVTTEKPPAIAPDAGPKNQREHGEED